MFLFQDDIDTISIVYRVGTTLSQRLSVGISMLQDNCSLSLLNTSLEPTPLATYRPSPHILCQGVLVNSVLIIIIIVCRQGIITTSTPSLHCPYSTLGTTTGPYFTVGYMPSPWTINSTAKLTGPPAIPGFTIPGGIIPCGSNATKMA